MKVYVVQIAYCTGSWGDTDSWRIDSIKDSEQKAQARIEELANAEMSEKTDDGDYPKITENTPGTITIARDGYEDEDFTSYFYEEYEVG